MSECIRTTWGLSTRGYGHGRRNGRDWKAHRWEWTQRNGPIPDGLHVLHRCDNPACINIEHLFLGTHQDNMDDMTRKGRRAVGRAVAGNAKLTVEQVYECRLLWSIGLHTMQNLADRYGVGTSNISQLVNMKSYRDVH